MLAITGNAILVATEQQAPCFFFFWRVRPHAFEKGDLRIQRTCLLAWWAWMFVLELRIHSEDHILEPLALALEPESANERNKILWLRITCTVCLEWSCSVVLFTVAWERAVQRMLSTALVADKIGRLGSLSIFTHYMVHNTGAFCCTLPAESWGPMNQRAFLHKL